MKKSALRLIYFLVISLLRNSDLSALGAQYLWRSFEEQDDNIEKTITYCERSERIRVESARQFKIQILGEVKR